MSYSVNDGSYPRTLVSATYSGFSKSQDAKARSIDDLFKFVHSLGLPTFNDQKLNTREKLGEGASYEVLQGRLIGPKQMVAVKRIKMPRNMIPTSSIERHVECVLRDIEVMHHFPLARHENILSLIGCGWSSINNDIVPYIVTEYAELGTMREYLQSANIPLRARLSLCSQVACGLGRLHWAGVAHGDIKMENVLVFPLESAKSSYEAEVVVKLADFGHACLLSDSQAGGGSSQNYFGTDRYRAPELEGNSRAQEGISFLKCDLWALGLLCWETYAGGRRYFELKTPKNMALQCEAIDFVDNMQETREVPSIIRSIMKGILRKCLVESPDMRAPSIVGLPFIFGRGLQDHWNEGNYPIPIHHRTDDWSYQIFEPQRAIQIPFHVQESLFQYFRREQIETSSKKDQASFHVALALANGFGTLRNTPQAWTEIATSSSPGAQIAMQMLTERLKGGEGNPSPPTRSLTSPRFESLRHIVMADRPSSITQNNKCNVNDINDKAEVLLPFSTYLTFLDGLAASSYMQRNITWPKSNSLNPLHFLFMYEHDHEGLKSITAAITQARSICSDGHGIITECGQRVGPINIEALSPNVYLLDPQIPVRFYGTPLSFAAVTGSIESAKVLLSLGANPLRNDYSVPGINTLLNPIQIAVSYHHEELFRLLWLSCLNDDGKREELFTIFRGQSNLISCLGMNSKAARWLMHGQFEMEVCTRMIRTLLSILKDLFQHGSIAQHSFEPLFLEGLLDLLKANELALALKLIECADDAELFVETKPEQSAKVTGTILDLVRRSILSPEQSLAYIELGRKLGITGLQAVMAALESRNQTLLLYLLKDGHGRSEIDSKGWGVLWHMISSGVTDTFPLSNAFRFGFDPNVRNANGESVIYFAIREKKLQDLQMLLEAGADLMFCSHEGKSVLHVAAEQNSDVVFESLWSWCTTKSVEIRQLALSDIHGITPLHIAAGHRNIRVARCLEQQYVDYFARDNNGQTALHWAFDRPNTRNIPIDTFVNGSFQMARYLVLSGADLFSVNNEGSSALDVMVAQAQHHDHFTWLLDLWPQIARKAKQSLLHIAVFQLNCSMVDFLLRKCEDINDQDDLGETPGHKFVSRLRRLLQKGCETQISESRGPALMMAKLIRDSNVDLSLQDAQGFAFIDHLIRLCPPPSASRDKLYMQMLGLFMRSRSDDDGHTGSCPSRSKGYLDYNPQCFCRYWLSLAMREHKRPFCYHLLPLAMRESKWRIVDSILSPFAEEVPESLYNTLRWPAGPRLLVFALENRYINLIKSFVGPIVRFFRQHAQLDLQWKFFLVNVEADGEDSPTPADRRRHHQWEDEIGEAGSHSAFEHVSADVLVNVLINWHRYRSILQPSYTYHGDSLTPRRILDSLGVFLIFIQRRFRKYCEQAPWWIKKLMDATFDKRLVEAFEEAVHQRRMDHHWIKPGPSSSVEAGWKARFISAEREKERKEERREPKREAEMM